MEYNQTNLKDFVIDKKTRAVLNTNQRALEVYKMKIEKIKNEEKINSLEGHIQKIENLLKLILEEKTNGSV